MPTTPIPESPTARVLLELAASSADARVMVGGRAVLLRNGALADVGALPGDLSFADFLLAAERIDRRDLDAVIECAEERSIGLDQALRELDAVSEEVLFATRRALLVDRLVRAFAVEELDDGAAPEPMPLTQLVLDSAYATLELVLDALARRAAFGFAERIGALPTARFVWLESAEQRRAAEWADLGDIPIAVSLGTLFPRHPAAPSRLAALLRAGIAKLDVSDGSTSGFGRASEESTTLAAHQVSAPPESAQAADEMLSAEARREESNAIEESAPAAADVGPLRIEPVACWLETTEQSLADPLSALEARANELDADAADGRERAQAWLALADAWLTQQHSYLEAARAAREAAAADPSNVEALACAATYTAAAGAPEIALAYALAWAERCEPGVEQARALASAADFAERAGDGEQLLVARRRAVEVHPSDSLLHEQLARTLATRELLQPAVEHARKAAELLRDDAPERARALLEWAARLLPGNLRTWTDLARVLSRAARGAAAVATLAQAARIQKDSALRERLRTSAVTFAEAGGRADLAAEVLLEAVDSQGVDLERLLSNLYVGGDWAMLWAIAIELAAKKSGPERTGLLIHAAEASIALGQRARGLALLSDAVVCDPEHAEACERLEELASELADPYAVRDALERSFRVRCPDRAALGSLDEDKRAELAALLESLSAQLSQVDDAPHARDVAELLYELDGRTLGLETARTHEQQLAAYEADLQQREQALRAARPLARTQPALALASLCRVAPGRRGAARKLYARVVQGEPEHTGALSELEALLRLEGDHDGLRALYEANSAATAAAEPLLALAYLELQQGELDRAYDACWRAVAIDSRNVEALTLTWRLASTRGDHERALSALRTLAEAYPPGPQRARVLMRVARAERASGQREQAALTVCAALSSDSDCADAALVLVADCAHLPKRERAAALMAARATLGDSADVLHELARASYAGAAAPAQREALQTLLALCPHDAFPARALVALHSTGSDPAPLSEAIEAALSRERFQPETLYVVQQGLLRLLTLGQPQSAASLVLGAIPVLGERAQPLLPWAESTAAAAAADELACALLEQRIALADPQEQPELLRQLGARLRRMGVHWAEARAYLRLLSLEPDDASALGELAKIYARTNEAVRLRTVLEALHDGARTEEAQRERLFELALCALHFEADSERGAELVTLAVSPRREGRELHEVPVEALRRGIGLLRAAAPQRAFTLLRELAERASIPRARALLEEALVLAECELQDRALALEAAIQGTLSHPEHEPLVAALGRLARSLSRIDSWVDTLEAAAERTANPERQATLLVRAAELSERELNDGPRACALLDRAYRATPSDAIEQLALEGARTLFARDLRAGKLAYDRLRDTLHVRAKFGGATARARALVTLSRLADEIYFTREDAVRYAEAARATLASADDTSQEERASVLDALNQRLSTLALSEPAKPAHRGPSTVRRSFAESEAPLFKTVQVAPTLRPSGSLSPPQGVRPVVRSLLPNLEVGSPLVALAPVDIRSHGGVAATAVASPHESAETSSVHEIEPAIEAGVDSLDALLLAVASGQTSALAALADHLQADQAAARSACSALLQAVRARPLSVCSLRGLRLASSAASEHGLWRTASQALAYVEPHLRPPVGVRRRDAQGARAEAALNAARQSQNERAFELLAMLVEAAAPLFRRNLAAVLRTKGAPEPLREAPYAQLLTELGLLFGARHEAYAAASGEDRVGLVSAHPASIVIGDRTPRDAASLRFRLARAFECARAENVLLAILPPAEAEALFVAVRAAFGPAEDQGAQVPREAAAVAADLWRTMPSNAQRKLTRMLSELDVPLSFESLHDDVKLLSARVALVATRELDVALAQLGLDIDGGSAPQERSEGGFNRSLAHHALTRELVTYALSDSYLLSLNDQDQ
jgi:hypothetical protein